MDLTELINDSKARFSFNDQKQQLKNKYESKLIFAEQGGLWKASSELLTLLSTHSDKTIIILDLYENPIKIDRIQLLSKATATYNEIMDEWYNEYEEVKNYR